MTDKVKKYTQAALTLAYTICRDAIWLNDICSWIGVTNEEYYGMPKAYAKSLGTNFYDGTAGIAFFLTALYRVQQDEIIKKTANGALQHVINNELTIKNEDDFLIGKLGFHTGWTGCAYVLQSAGEVFNNMQYTEAARQLVKQCMNLPQEHWNIDVINGIAGAIPALITFYNKYKDDKLKEFIIELGRHLISKAHKSSMGMSWDTMPEKTNDLTGYGHGAAGIAHAFAELYTINPDKQYLKIIKDIAGYENAHFNQEQQNWPDFRSFVASSYQPMPQPVQQVCGLAWCHGAPGIGLSRLRAYEITQNSAFKHDAEVAIQTTLKANSSNLTGNFSLCHGLFGNAELFLKAAEVFKQPEYINHALRVADECISFYLDSGLVIPNGLQTLSETPDFMLGTSGIGYFFLRLIDPEKFPCMLLVTR